MERADQKTVRAVTQTCLSWITMLRNSGFELSKFVKTLLLALSLPDFRLIFSMSVCHIVVCLVLVLDNKDIRRLSGRFLASFR